MSSVGAPASCRRARAASAQSLTAIDTRLRVLSRATARPCRAPARRSRCARGEPDGAGIGLLVRLLEAVAATRLAAALARPAPAGARLRRSLRAAGGRPSPGRSRSPIAVAVIAVAAVAIAEAVLVAPEAVRSCRLPSRRIAIVGCRRGCLRLPLLRATRLLLAALAAGSGCWKPRPACRRRRRRRSRRPSPVAGRACAGRCRSCRRRAAATARDRP